MKVFFLKTHVIQNVTWILNIMVIILESLLAAFLIDHNFLMLLGQKPEPKIQQL